jgi:hypothetical protein
MPFGGPEAALAYQSRYTHRVAIANGRLITSDPQGVTFKWKDYRIKGRDRYKQMTLATDEFIRRILVHVLPKALHRIRHYGLSPKALAPTTSHAPVNCSPLQNVKANPPLPPSIPASRTVHAAAVA